MDSEKLIDKVNILVEPHFNPQINEAHVYPSIFQQIACLCASMSKDDAAWALHFEKAGPGQVQQVVMLCHVHVF